MAAVMPTMLAGAAVKTRTTASAAAVGTPSATAITVASSTAVGALESLTRIAADAGGVAKFFPRTTVGSARFAGEKEFIFLSGRGFGNRFYRTRFHGFVLDYFVDGSFSQSRCVYGAFVRSISFGFGESVSFGRIDFFGLLLSFCFTGQRSARLNFLVNLRSIF